MPQKTTKMDPKYVLHMQYWAGKWHICAQKETDIFCIQKVTFSAPRRPQISTNFFFEIKIIDFVFQAFPGFTQSGKNVLGNTENLPLDSELNSEWASQYLMNSDRYNALNGFYGLYGPFIPQPQTRGGSGSGYKYYGYGSPRVSRSLDIRPRRYGKSVRCKFCFLIMEEPPRRSYPVFLGLAPAPVLPSLAGLDRCQVLLRL
jgi:hypothetical protein